MSCSTLCNFRTMFNKIKSNQTKQINNTKNITKKNIAYYTYRIDIEFSDAENFFAGAMICLHQSAHFRHRAAKLNGRFEHANLVVVTATTIFACNKSRRCLQKKTKPFISDNFVEAYHAVLM